MRMRIRALALAAPLFVYAGAARAQDVALPDPVTPPVAQAAEPEVLVDVNREIDISNIVTSAAKGVTTVQEAPAIITILTADEIKARGFRTVQEAMATVPGWSITMGEGQQAQAAVMVRGIGQGVLMLRDGISMFDPFGNFPMTDRGVPIESIKRLELVTGPGGVLWGANSFLGVANMIMKDADDVHGVELSAGYGDGPGNKQDVRAYALFGKTFLDHRVKIFQHVSFESYIGQVDEHPQFQLSEPAPQIPGTAFFGGNTGVLPARSWLVIADGKYSFGPVSLLFHLPFGEQHEQFAFTNSIGPSNNSVNLDRHVALEYKDRYARGVVELTVRGYWAQFIRQFDARLVTSSLFPMYQNPDGTENEGGLHFGFSPQYQTLIQRAGATTDLALDLRHGIRILIGGEFFYESMLASTELFQSQTWGDPSSAPVPTATPAALPLLCPQRQSADGKSFTPVPECPRVFVADQYRLVTSAYVDLQYHPTAKLGLEGGVRVQYGFGGRGYPVVPLYSGAIVYNFAPDYHLKLNYSTGFRPPTFIVTDVVAGGVSFGANANLKNELSQSFEGELNARLLRNRRGIRELDLRLDYSYTVLTNLIGIHGSTYLNTGERSIHAAEALAKLYLEGDHFLTASYTFLFTTTSDAGILRNVPNQWISLGASINLVRGLLDVNTNLIVTGAYQDPNRVPTRTAAVPGSTSAALSSDLVFDRLTPVALLQLGFRLRFLRDRLQLSGQLYNVLNQRYYVADPFYDLTPSVDMTPTPAPGFSFFASASYRF